MSDAKKAGRAQRLRARRRPTAPFQLEVVDTTEAVAELEAAKSALEITELRDASAEELDAARERVAKARAAVADCYEPIVFTAMDPTEFEDLVAEHPAREGKDERWAPTFPHACFLACVDDTMSTEEWEAFVKENVSQGEREAMYTVAIGVNARWPSGGIPND